MRVSKGRPIGASAADKVLEEGVNKNFTEKQPLGVVHPQRMEGQQSVVLQRT